MSQANTPGSRERAEFRRRVYDLLEPSTEVRVRVAGFVQFNASFLVEAILVAVILINSASLILWTVPDLKAAYAPWFQAIEHCTVAVFLVEYVLRLWVAPEAKRELPGWRQRLRYTFSPTALIDASALAPSAIAAAALLATGEGLSLSFLLAVRLLTRTLKLARYFTGGRRLGAAVRLKGGQLLAAVGGLLLVLVIAAALMYFAETEAQPEVFSSVPAAMWWSVVTLTTVGYGDTVPVTATGRLLAAVIAVLGIGLFALPAGILSAGLLETETSDAPGSNLPGDWPGAGLCPHCGQPMPNDDNSNIPTPLC